MKKKNKKKSFYAYVCGHPFDTSSYFKTNIQPEASIGKSIAAIYSRGDDAHPQEFNFKLKKLIADALSSGVSQPHESEKTVIFMK